MEFRTREGDKFTVFFSEYGSVTMQFPKYTQVMSVELFNNMVERGDIRALPRHIPARS